MTDAFVFLAVTVAVAAVVCGHQGQPWPLAAVWRTVRARQAREAPCAPLCGPQTLVRLPLRLQHAPEASQAPLRPSPSWARKDAA